MGTGKTSADLPGFFLLENQNARLIEARTREGDALQARELRLEVVGSPERDALQSRDTQSVNFIQKAMIEFRGGLFKNG